MPICESEKNHPGVKVVYLHGELACPLCEAKDQLETAVTREEIEARTGWLKEERDAWRKRAEQAELNPGTPYRMEDEDEDGA